MEATVVRCEKIDNYWIAGMKFTETSESPRLRLWQEIEKWSSQVKQETGGLFPPE